MSRGWWSLTWAAQNRVKYLVFTGSPSLQYCRMSRGWWSLTWAAQNRVKYIGTGSPNLEYCRMSHGWWSLTWAAQNRVKYLVFTGSHSLRNAGCLTGGCLSHGQHRIEISI